MRYQITEYYRDGFDRYIMTYDACIYHFGIRLWKMIIAGRFSNLYSVEQIS